MKYELTPREERVAALLASGFDREGAAREMGISLSTAAKLMRSLVVKTKSETTLQAVAVLVARGALRPSQFIKGADPEPQPGPASELVHVRILTELNPGKLAGLGDAYRALALKGM